MEEKNWHCLAVGQLFFHNALSMIKLMSLLLLARVPEIGLDDV